MLEICKNSAAVEIRAEIPEGVVIADVLFPEELYYKRLMFFLPASDTTTASGSLCSLLGSLHTVQHTHTEGERAGNVS